MVGEPILDYIEREHHNLDYLWELTAATLNSAVYDSNVQYTYQLYWSNQVRTSHTIQLKDLLLTW